MAGEHGPPTSVKFNYNNQNTTVGRTPTPKKSYEIRKIKKKKIHWN